MNVINKQKFLAELGRLLTFMYDEDRKMALAMYSDMFDSCRDEDLLVQSLGSPTRQAVAIARNYDAKDRKLQLTSGERGSTVPGEVPAFMITIGNIMDEALEGNKFSKPVDENQFSLFGDDDQPHVDFDQPIPGAVPLENSVETAPAVLEAVTVAEEEESATSVLAAAIPAAAAVTAAVFEEEAVPEVEPAELSEPVTEPAVTYAPVRSEVTVDDFLAGILDEESFEEPAPAEESIPEDTVPADVEDDLAEAADSEPMDPVDQFIADFSFEDEASKPDVPVELTEDADPETVPEDAETKEVYPSLYDEDDFYTETEPKLKASPVLLILYIIAAIPLTLIGIAVLLVLTAAVLALAAGCVVGGLFVFSAGLSGLTMIADLMVVLGGGIALFALGLLFLWTAVWLVCGALVGLIRGVFTLAKKWCYKEVEQ